MSAISANMHKHWQRLAGFDIFHPSRLSTEDDIAEAIRAVEDSLDIIFCSLQPVHPYVFEFIVSCKLALSAPGLSDH